MAVREQRHAGRARPRRRWVSWIPEALIALVVVAAIGNAQFDLGHRWFGLDRADPASDPAQVLPPAGLDLVSGTPAPLVAAAQVPGRISAAAVKKALATLVHDPELGKRLSIAVSEVATGKILYQQGPAAITPASTMKLLTSTAALETLGPMKRFATTVVGTGKKLVLVGGGDPFLASSPKRAHGQYPARADLVTLAQRTAAALKASGIRTISLDYDASLFSGPAVNPHWPASYLPEFVVPPISALWVDEARIGNGQFAADPAAMAAAAFATALGKQGIAVTRAKHAPRAPSTAKLIAKVESAPLGEIVQQTLAVSDNNAAEVLSRHVGDAVSGDASFVGGAAGVLKVLRGLRIPVTGSQVYDGSGLSRQDLLTPGILLGVLQAAASTAHPELREVITGLPVAGFNGSLRSRFDRGPAEALGRVRAKTGTLTGVHGLAGLATDVDGNLMAFVMVADRVAEPDQLAAQHDLDLMAAALSACSCGT